MQEATTRSRRAAGVAGAARLGEAAAGGVRTPHVYPTPTSLVSPFGGAPDKEGPSYLVPPASSTVGLEAVGGEEGWGIPLLVGRVERRLEPTVQVKRRRPRRRLPAPVGRNEDTLPEDVVMDRIRQQHLRSSFFGPHFPSNSNSLRETASNPESICIPIGAEAFARHTAVPDSLLARLLDRSEGIRSHSFAECPGSAGMREELRCSLSSIFLPVCKKYCASLDTACLAYTLLARAAPAIPPRLSTTRNQMYIAALMIAFKFNEEEDPVVADFAKTILKTPHRPSTFQIPPTASVIRMEQRMMRAINWRAQDIVNPLVLTFALLDSLHPSLDLSFAKKRKLAIMAELFLVAMLAHPRTLLAVEGGFDVVRWTIFALGSVFHLHCRRREPRHFIRQLYRSLYPRQWSDARNAPSWYDQLAAINVRSSILADRLLPSPTGGRFPRRCPASSDVCSN